MVDMRSNPFFVDPSLDLSTGLRGLQAGFNYRQRENVIAAKEKEKTEESERKRKASIVALAAYKTGDPDKIAEAILMNPDIGETLGELYDRQRDYATEDYASSLEKLLTEIETTGKIAPVEKPAESSLSGLEAVPSKPETKLITKTDIIRSIFNKDPKAGKQMLEYEFAKSDPKKYKAWKEVYRSDETEGTPSALKKMMNERDALKKSLTESGMSPKDIIQNKDIKAFQKKISGTKETEERISPHLRMINERDALTKSLIDSGMTPEEVVKNPDIVSFNRKILGEGKEWAPSTLKKQFIEREELKAELEKQGLTEDQILDHPDIIAYDNAIAGSDTTMRKMWTQEQIDVWGAIANLNMGKIPSVGRGKDAGILRQKIAWSAAKQALGNPQFGGGEDVSPSQAALNVVAMSHDTKAIGSAIVQLNKQIASMDSFVQNMDEQIDEVSRLSEDLFTFDIRLLNIPWRFLRGKIAGSALQTKYDLYLTELARENNKLAQGATQSIAAMSVEETKVWDRIHDKNLSVKDMLEVLRATRRAADIRMRSVQNALDRARAKSRTRDFSGRDKLPVVRSKADGGQADFDALDPGDVYIGADGKRYKKP